jgi:hypothetical protein
MKRFAMAVLVACTLSMGAGSAAWGISDTSRDYEDAISHPLRIAAYAAHPVGFALEWLVFRPFHYIISRPYLDRVFGYRPLGEEGQYRQYGERL